MAQRGTAADTTSDPLDRPVLAPATWLVGQLQESALEHPPWAVEQPKRGYVEMSELAYRVAEQATGDQTIDEIATAVSTALRRPVSAVDVEALIDTVLIPRGVIRGSNGQVHADDGAGDEEPARVPLARDRRGRARRVGSARPVRPERIIGPKRLEAVAAILMWLFWPPVMLVVVGVGLAAMVWLFTMHGLARGLIQVLAVPILLPVTLVVTVLGAAVQGIGPMVALYSGGATIQRLRISTSLGRPRLEVDVADDYGLSRWARLAVNVSGVYLQLVVTLVLCILGRALGAEFLLLAVALLTLNMLRLLLPFGRPGADRLLADWLLVQHPLRYAGPALERFMPGLAVAQRPLPSLKRWGRVSIGAYLLAVTIVLGMVGLVILWTAPTVVATTWAALSAYLASMAEALGERDAIGFLGSLFNAAVLALMSFCIVVALIVAVRGLLAGAWAWSRETPRRRLLGVIGAVLLAFLVVLFWVPVRGWGTNGAPRSLAGVPFRSLTELSRGTLFDLFGETSGVDVSGDQSGGHPIVTTDIGSGAVEGPAPGQATPATGSGATTGSMGSTSSEPAVGTPAAKPGPIGAETPGPDSAGRGTPQPSGQEAEGSGAPATSVGANAQPGPGQGMAGPGAAPAARGTAGADEALVSQATSETGRGPARQATTGPNNQTGAGPASKPTAGAAEKPVSRPTGAVVVQPVNKPTTSAAGQPAPGAAGQPSTKPGTGASGLPASKPPTQATRGPGTPTSAQP